MLMCVFTQKTTSVRRTVPSPLCSPQTHNANGNGHLFIIPWPCPPPSCVPPRRQFLAKFGEVALKWLDKPNIHDAIARIPSILAGPNLVGRGMCSVSRIPELEAKDWIPQIRV
ncbi:hypothetical protein Ddc_11302 [Ditylenchus destructor]|nr:hypothetical protein Ddc_11302 [Ditylenchus destructor]